MINKKKIINKLIESTILNCEKDSEMTINYLKSSLSCNLTLKSTELQVSDIIDDIINELEYELQDEDIISYEDDLNDIIHSCDIFDIDVRKEMFNILIEPIVFYFEEDCKNDYKIEIDEHSEKIRIYKEV